MLIWSDNAENRSDPLMKVNDSFFEYRDVPRSIDRETSIAMTTFSSRSACVWRTYGAFNRATPKTQSALLEAMQERQVTLADTTFPLEDPFWVLATQNPVEQEGVYALPEAQLDRFSMMLRVGYPAPDEEVRMLHVRLAETTIERRVSPDDVVLLRQFIGEAIHVDDKIMEYIVRLGRATRSPEQVGCGHLREMLVLGISPRSYQHILALARVTAFLRTRTFVLPEDVKEIFCDAARHRIARSVRAQAENIDADAILQELLRSTPIP